jgi:hypothetical protein
MGVGKAEWLSEAFAIADGVTPPLRCASKSCLLARSAWRRRTIARWRRHQALE